MEESLLPCLTARGQLVWLPIFNWLIQGKNYRKIPYFMGKSMVSGRFSLFCQPIDILFPDCHDDYLKHYIHSVGICFSARSGEILIMMRSSTKTTKNFAPMVSGWWFGTFFIFPYIGDNHPNWLIFFRGVETTNQINIHKPWLLE